MPLISRNPAHTPIPDETPSYPAAHDRTTALGGSNRRPEAFKPTHFVPQNRIFRTFREKSVKIPQKREGTHFGKKN